MTSSACALRWDFGSDAIRRGSPHWPEPRSSWDGIPDFSGRSIVFEDLLSDTRYIRDGDDLLARGFYLEMPPDGYHLFRILGHTPHKRDSQALA
jgi:hypothetical protein